MLSQCNPDSSPTYDDPSNKNLQFFRLNTNKFAPPPNTFKKRTPIDEYFAIENTSPNVSTTIKSSLDGRAVFGVLEDRAPSPGACGGKGGGSSLPDSIGKV